MNKILDEKTLDLLREKFRDLKKEVKIKFYRKGCKYCEEIEGMIKEISGTSEKISYEVIDGKGPYITFEDYENVQFWGIPAMYEFSAFVKTIEMVGKGVSLPLNIAKSISKARDIEIMVFVTPQCPYCPGMAISSNKFAIFNKKIKSLIIEATEFPEISERYLVMAVPKIVIKKDEEILDEWEGAMPETQFARRVEEACTIS